MLLHPCSCRVMLFNGVYEAPYVDGRVADIDGVVRVGRLHIQFQDVVDEMRLDLQGAETLHHPGLAAQGLKHTAGRQQQELAA